ncbi:protein sprint isoform X4 [Hermetia illucens]|uniref:protein sprint isoform X4 n=1 Tax=Hermetia illucens TaxID=343691 RepID=UPI0018CC7875|nr:protein sprint isoform X4 [Hermetia illucens]
MCANMFRIFRRSAETTTTTHHQHHQQHITKPRRLPFCGGNDAGSDVDAIINSSGGGVDTLNSLEADGDGLMEDDLQALLPNCRQLSRDELSQSHTSLVSSSDGGILGAGETSSESSESSTSPPCDLGLMERLLRTHPVWFLPGIQRAGAVHLLQGKEEGNFIVRGSSQPKTMAVSVRLPPDTGPYIEHYLIQSNDGMLSLESSRFKFDSIPALIAHYAQCCDELPVQLVLPRVLREAKNRQQLSSLALLGQEFWRYPMANPKPGSANPVDVKSPNSLTDTSGIGTTLFSSSTQSQQSGQQPQPPSSTGHPPQQFKMFSPTGLGGVFNSQAGTPSDTTSSLSSFTTSAGLNQQLMSPESVDSVILTMSPVDANRSTVGSCNNNVVTENVGSLTTFKQIAQKPALEPKPTNTDQAIRCQRPTPPNTLNLAPLRPPAPPARWSKPLTPISPVMPPPNDATHNFTVTTTVTFSVDNKQSQQIVEVTSPASNNNNMNSCSSNNNSGGSNSTSTFQTFAKRLSPEGECKTTVDTLSSQGSSWHHSSQTSKDSNQSQSQRKLMSPTSVDTPPSSGRQRRSKIKKESKHYQESDILESPQVYCRSALGDKISDYEDLWSQDTAASTPLGNRTGTQLSSFKPIAEGVQGKQRPDLLPETPTITSLNCNVLSPPSSISSSSNPSPPIKSGENKDPNNDAAHKPPNILSPDAPKQFIPPAAEMEIINQRNRLGLVLPIHVEEAPKTECDTPTNQTPLASRSKQGSPFYAEPADALRAAAALGSSANILRRSQRGNLLPANHRHSEPPKGGLARTPMCPVLAPAELEKLAGSLDELKKKQQKKARGRLDPWPLDSSWEFMGNEGGDGGNYGDYDSAGQQWNVLPSSQTHINNNNNSTSHMNGNAMEKTKPLTVHQIIAKRLPDLNLPELIRCSTPQQNSGVNSNQPCEIIPTDVSGPPSIIDQQSNHRMSSYDNVERNGGGNLSYTTSFLMDSAQSDDGTVFSEPWDSSQWDSFLPHDDTSDTIHMSKCRPILCNSEDDTIIEESTLKDNQGTLKGNNNTCSNSCSDNQQKIATILRNRSCRDRDVLCHPRNKSQYGGPEESIRDYTLQLANDHSSTFSRNIENFIACTKESREPAPQVVMRNMRQFMSGMKNYLVKHGEGEFHQEVQKARSQLKSDEFLNLDAILEAVMHQLVVLPLREHLYGLFVDYYTRSGDIQLLVQNVKYACARNAPEFGIRPCVAPPSPPALAQIGVLLVRLQEAELPLEKLELFLCVISSIFDATGCPRGQQLGADDFLPILVYVVAKCGFVGAEIEAEYMWGLLQPALLNGEAGYYLTALCSAVHVLKSFIGSDNEGTGSLDWRSSSLPACSSVLRVIIPDECNGSLQTRTLPVRPHTTTRDVCRIIAHKARITNPQDYGLFKLVDGEETLLVENECPQDARIAARGKHCMLAYKRLDAKIAWPTATSA